MEAWWSLKNKHLDSQTPFWFLSFYAMLCLSSTERWLMCLHTLFSAPLPSQKSIFSFNKRFLNRVPADSWYPSLRSWQQTIFLCSVKVLVLPFDPCFMKWIRIGIWLKFRLPNLLVIVWFYLNAETPHAKYLLHTSWWSNGWDFVVPTERLLRCLNKLVFPWPQKSSIIRYFLLIINCWHDFGKMPTNFSFYVCANWDVGNHRLSNFGLKWRITSVQGFRAYNYLIWRCRLLICLPK